MSPTPSRKNLRIGVVQFNPKIGQVHYNINRARELCSKLQPRSLDLLCFPEMAFSGYVFDSAASIAPFLEHPHKGPTSLFCADLAKTLSCYVVAGYPEALSPDEDRPLVFDTTTMEEHANDAVHDPHADPASGAQGAQTAVGANSAVMYGPEGEWVGGYRKTNLYTTDKTWAKAGTGFATFHFLSPLSPLTLGICMDLNTLPHNTWTSLEDGPYELASHALEAKARVVVLLNSWLHSAEPPEVGDDGKYDWNTLEYWAARFRPLWAADPKGRTSSAEERREQGGEQGEETIVVVCNRSGTENGTTFAGTSAIFSMVRSSGRPKLLDMIGKDEEGVRVWNISV